ncbi:MAG TPA: glycine zipper 2TM domain-containing protein [Albitalea sp.]|nr:glycine zipper 2TM domain-containing protein [Albitalea sp.]
MSARKLAILCSVSTLALVTACAYNPPRNEAAASAPVVVSNATRLGYVTNIEMVPVAARTSGGGAVLGAVVGAVIGNQIGSGSGRAAATGLGAVGGAVIGNNIEQHNRSDSEFYRVSVRVDHGRVEQFDYQTIGNLRIGDRVRIEGGQLYLD